MSLNPTPSDTLFLSTRYFWSNHTNLKLSNNVYHCFHINESKLIFLFIEVHGSTSQPGDTHSCYPSKEKQKQNKTKNKNPAFVSLGEDHRCISTFWLLWTVNSIFISSCFWQNFLLSIFFFFASGCLFIENERKSKQGNCLYVFSCLPFLHLILAFMVRMWGCIRDSIKVYSLQARDASVAKIGCKMKTCWRHMIATEQKLISHWKALLKNLRYHYFFKHCYYIIWR